MERTKAYNAALLDQADDLLQQLSDTELSAQRSLLFGGTIGQHVRHVVEYYSLLLTQCATGRINYDRRERDRRIETDRDHARSVIRRCVDLLNRVPDDRQLILDNELPGPAGTMTQATSLARELTYVADHCVHHLAMVRIVVEQELPEITFPEELGVAAATRNHRAR